MYSGDVLSDAQAEQLDDDMYTFGMQIWLFLLERVLIPHVSDLDLIQTEAGLGGRHTRGGGLETDTTGAVSDHAEFCVDSKHMGTVARFINHSCAPNLFVQTILFDHHDKRMPWIALFAAENIAPLVPMLAYACCRLMTMTADRAYL